MLPDILQLGAGILLIVAGLFGATYITRAMTPTISYQRRFKNEPKLLTGSVEDEIVEAKWRKLPASNGDVKP